MGSDIQFVGIDDLIDAYVDRGVDRWALFAGKRPITQGEGADDLRSFLMRIAKSQTTATYILKVFEDLGEEKIRVNTPDDGSFNFKLFSVFGTGTVGSHYGGSIQEKILERLDGLEAKLMEPGDDGIVGQITKAFIGMLEEPHKLHDFIGALNGVNPPSGTLPPFAGRMNAVGSMARTAPKSSVNYPEVITEQNAERISLVIKKLAAYDPKFLEHLEMIADIAEKTPAKFKTLLSLLPGI